MISWLWVLWIASSAVIVGVILEEIEKTAKAIRLLFTEGLKPLLAAVRKKSVSDLISYIGFIILVVGLSVELLAQTYVEVASNSELARANARSAPRDITNSVTADLSRYADRVSIVGISVASYIGDEEAGRLGAEIILRLEAVHFLVANNTLTFPAGPPARFGIAVSGFDHSLIEALVRWLNASNLHAYSGDPPEVAGFFPAGGQRFRDPSMLHATIFIFSKPLPPIDP